MSVHEERRGGGHEDKRGWGSSSGSGGDKWAARLYVGRLSRNISERDIDDTFGKYGRIREIGFCFVQYEDPRDAEDALRALDGTRIQGNDERILVEFAKGSTWRGSTRDSRGSSFGGGGSNRFDRPPERCFNCGQVGMGQEDCPTPPGSGERSRRYEENRCFTCGQPGHRARECSRSLTSSRKRSRSPYRPERDRSPARSSRSPHRSERERGSRDRHRDHDRDSRRRDRDRGSRDRDRDRSPRERNHDREKERNRDRSSSKERSPRRRSETPPRHSSRRSLSPH
ncbi:hypothetical protein G9A89_005203 [Geosiphon pyriformis]|nr:hypothetical protein G9A89_005203 [Geosiphon pyriformis]